MYGGDDKKEYLVHKVAGLAGVKASTNWEIPKMGAEVLGTVHGLIKTPFFTYGSHEPKGVL